MNGYGTLTWIDTFDNHSLYQDRNGDYVHLAHGGFRRLVDLDDLDLAKLWKQWTTPLRCHELSFHEHVEGYLIHPDKAEYIGFCADCGEPSITDDLNDTNENHGKVCDDCKDNYYFCVSCEELFGETTTTLSDDEVCERCRARYWHYCDNCEGYVHDDEGHYHDNSCDCEVPGDSFHFTVRNDGNDPLANDERVTVWMPAGVISDEGLQAIQLTLRTTGYQFYQDTKDASEDSDYNRYTHLRLRLKELGNEWQTKQGNFTKRLSRFAYNEFKIKIAPEVLSQIGCIARDHSIGREYHIEVTRNLNLPPEDFGHEESCWWGEYRESRCALKTNGGFGLRTFDGDRGSSWSSVTGRAWVMPLKQVDGRLTPTFETQQPAAFIVFNGYGDLSGYAPARVMAHMAGMTYRKVSFYCDPMYINSESGYLVAPEEIAKDYTDGSLSLTLSDHANLFDYENQKKVLTNV